MKYQYPRFSEFEKKILRTFGTPSFLETSLGFWRLKRFYFAAIKRGIRSIAEKHNNLALTGHIKLPMDFEFDENLAQSRGNQVHGVAYSMSYEKNFLELPNEVQDLVLSFKGVVENYFAYDANLNHANIWRNMHVPADIINNEAEVFADAFHQDLVFDQYNIQLFILLQDTNEVHGPFEYLSEGISGEDMKYYRKRNRKKALNDSIKLTGKRGDFMLFTTGFTLHRAGVPKEGFHRDIFSIAFFPSYTKIGTPISELVRERGRASK